MATTYSISQSVYYVYEHIRKDTGQVFYVGKGKGKRAYSRHQRNRHWKFIYAKAGGFEIRFLGQNLDEELAFLVEIERIDQLKRLGVSLCNYTLGGDGCSGYRHTPEAKLKIGLASSQFMKGRRQTDEAIQKMILSKTGRKHTEEHKQKISLGNMGKVISPETVEKRRQKVLGRKNSPEACKRISEGKLKANARKRQETLL